jgi:hypothetical protein
MHSNKCVLVSILPGNSNKSSFHRRLHPSLYNRRKRMHYSPCSISTPPLSPQLPPSRLRERLHRGSRFPLPVGLQCGRSWCWTKKRRISSLQYYGCRTSERLVLPFTCMFSLLLDFQACLWVSDIFRRHTKATSLVSTPAVRRPCHLLRCSNPGKYQENCTRPPERSL